MSQGRRLGMILAAVLAVAAGLRAYRLGGSSFWYDEVVTMRLARAGGPAALLDQLARIDATRAPLHPMLLAGWVSIFGASEEAARASSVLCGLATVWLIFEIGRACFDVRVGFWAAWLAAMSPVLIVYSREARMYAWLVLLTCSCWRMLLGRDRPMTTAGAMAYALGLVALAYSHPLGLIMIAALVLASLLAVGDRFGSWRRWLALHMAAAGAVAPWFPRYLDHPPEFLSGPLPLRFLLGTPIGFIGGNFATLAALAALIAWGIGRAGRWRASASLLLWLIVPPTALYLYSRAFQPIFGPARYTVYSAPAFLILAGLGLARSSATVRYPLAVGLSLLAVSGLWGQAYDPGRKADWRGFAADLAARPEGKALVIVATSGQGPNIEVETARYYLPVACEAIGLEEATADRLGGADAIYLAVGTRRGVPVATVPERVGPYRFRPDRSYPGLATFRAEHRPTRDGP